MGYAIIQTGGKQYQVEPGRFYDVELLHHEAEDKLAITDVLLVNLDGTIVIGQPHVPNAVVDVTVMKHYKAKKVVVYKMKPKKKTRKKNGHRQQLTRIMVDTIRLGDGQTISREEPALETVDTIPLEDGQTTSTEEPALEAVDTIPLEDGQTTSTEEPTLE